MWDFIFTPSTILYLSCYEFIAEIVDMLWDLNASRLTTGRNILTVHIFKNSEQFNQVYREKLTKLHKIITNVKIN